MDLPKSNWAQSITEPPFRAYPVTGGITFTYGGLKVSTNCNVLKKNGKINSLAIITESNSFRDTIILTIIFGSDDDIKKMILYTQNTSFTKNYSKIRILTEKENLMISNTGNKFPFYLVEKIL